MSDFKVQVLSDGDATVAQVTLKVSGVEVTHTGSAKKHPKDVSDPSVGEALAISRAMEKAATALRQHAEYSVRVASNPNRAKRYKFPSVFRTLATTPLFSGA